jgi:excisionase family DNA binding protein
MTVVVDAFIAELDEKALAVLAERLRPFLTSQNPDQGGWLNTDQAATHLCCPRSRIHDLVQLGKLEPCRDGRRLLFKRTDLDAYLEGQR